MNKILESLLETGALGNCKVMRRLIESGKVSENDVLEIAEETGVFSVLKHANDLKDQAVKEMDAIDVCGKSDIDDFMSIAEKFSKIRDLLPEAGEVLEEIQTFNNEPYTVHVS